MLCKSFICVDFLTTRKAFEGTLVWIMSIKMASRERRLGQDDASAKLCSRPHFMRLHHWSVPHVWLYFCLHYIRTTNYLVLATLINLKRLKTSATRDLIFFLGGIGNSGRTSACFSACFFLFSFSLEIRSVWWVRTLYNFNTNLTLDHAR